MMQENNLDIYQRLTQLLADPKINDCPNRRGLRLITGDLLEGAFLQICIALEPDLSVEIGAHEADFSIALKKAVPNIIAKAYEANPYVFKKYMEMPGDRLQNIDYAHCAICEKTGVIDLHIPRKWSKGDIQKENLISSVRPRNDQQFDYEVLSVPALTIVDALKDIVFNNAVAWIDVEGGQKNVLEGADSFLSKASAIYVEVESKQVWDGQSVDDDIARLLKEYQFVPVLRDNLALFQYNEIYVKEGAEIHALVNPIIQQYYCDIKSALEPESKIVKPLQ